MKRTLIPPELRPHVPGSDVRASGMTNPPCGVIERINNVIASAQIVVIGSASDGTARYFFECSSDTSKIAIIHLEDIADVIAFASAITKTRRRPGIYLRLCGSGDALVAQAQTILCDTLRHYQGRVLHRSNDDSLNFSKPLQLAVLKKGSAPISIPHTRICHTGHFNREDPVCIVKSISASRSTVSVIDDRFSLSGLGMTQELILGINVRVHCFNGMVFAWKIITNMVDYRVDDKVTLVEFDLPLNIKMWCLQASNSESLQFSGIDLIYQDNEWFCLEINPSPGYHFYEKRISPGGRRPITDAIILWLKEDKADK